MCLHLCTDSQCVAYTFVTNRIEAYAYNKPEVTGTTVSRNMEICRRRTSMRVFFFLPPPFIVLLVLFLGYEQLFLDTHPRTELAIESSASGHLAYFSN